MYYTMIAAAVLPAILLGLYIWRKDPHPEPFSWLFRAFLAGVFICIPVASIEQYISYMLFGEGNPTTLSALRRWRFSWLPHRKKEPNCWRFGCC